MWLVAGMPTTAPSPDQPRGVPGDAARPAVRVVPGPAALGRATQAVRVGDQVFVSGQLALDEDGKVVGAADCRAQSVQCFTNVQAILRAAGAELSDVVKVVCYLTDAADAATYAEVRRQFMGHSPATTAVVVEELLVPEALLELDVTAVLSSTTSVD